MNTLDTLYPNKNRAAYGNYTPYSIVTPVIDNYIYLYHTSRLLIIPAFPESITDSMPAQYQSTPIMGRSAPIYSYSNSGPRSIDVQLKLHRDMFNQINMANSITINDSFNPNLINQDKQLKKDLNRDDYIDILINELQSIALPSYAASEKMVNPPLVAVRFGDQVFCKGIVEGGVTVSYSGPILDNPIYNKDGQEQFVQNPATGKWSKITGKGKYALIDISFKVTEVDPYDASIVAADGSLRGLNRTLERNLYRGAR